MKCTGAWLFDVLHEVKHSWEAALIKKVMLYRISALTKQQVGTVVGECFLLFSLMVNVRYRFPLMKQLL